MSKKILCEKIEAFLTYLQNSGTNHSVLMRCRGYLRKLYDFQSLNYVKKLTINDIYDFQKYLQIRKYCSTTVTGAVRTAIKYYCWLNGKDESDLTDNRNVLPTKCDCGQMKVKQGKFWKCPVCDKIKKIGRPSKARNTYYRPTTDFVVDNKQCKTCKFRANKIINGYSSCNYMLITGQSKVKNKNYKSPPHCTYYDCGDRLISRDDMEGAEN